MLLMIDNYDSFTYNLVQYFFELGQNVEVFRNDKISLEEIEIKSPDFLVISPGPCTPKEAGISVAAISHFSGKIPILGGVAQLGERRLCKPEVIGSIPFASTNIECRGNLVRRLSKAQTTETQKLSQ